MIFNNMTNEQMSESLLKQIDEWISDATFKLLESNPEYINADVLWVTDFVMNLTSKDRIEKMQNLRSEGTHFYGLRIGLNQHPWEPYFDQITTIGYVDAQVY